MKLQKNALSVIAGILGILALVLAIANVIGNVVTVLSYYNFLLGLSNLVNSDFAGRAIADLVLNKGFLAGVGCLLVGIGCFAGKGKLAMVGSILFALFSLMQAITIGADVMLSGFMVNLPLVTHNIDITVRVILLIVGVLGAIAFCVKPGKTAGILGIVAGVLGIVASIYFISKVSDFAYFGVPYTYPLGSLAMATFLVPSVMFLLAGLWLMKQRPAAAEPVPAAAPAAAPADPTAELKQYQDLLAAGMISMEEYEAQRKRIMGF